MISSPFFGIDQPDFVGKEELIRRIESAQADFLEVLADVPEHLAETPNAIGEWSLKDLLAHLIAHEQRALAELKAARKGDKPTLPLDDNDAFNAHAVESLLTRTFATVQADWLQSTAQVISAVKSMSDDEFDPSSSVCECLDDSVDGALANNTYSHYAEHLPELEAWLRAVT